MAKKKNIENTLADDIRAAIKFGGKQVDEIADATGVPKSTILRFMKGADLRLSAASALAAHFDMRLWPRFVSVSTKPVRNVAKTIRAEADARRPKKQF